MKKTFTSFISTCLCLITIHSYAQWVPVASTGNGFVDDFEIFNGELYATGFFTTINGVNANYVAKWDGNTWQSVGTGFAEAGHNLKVIDNELYGLRYEQQIDSNWLYKFDGNNFQKFGTGVYLSNAVAGFSQTANLYKVIEYNDHIVVCGEFDRVGYDTISGIMQWNGASWDSMGAGLSGHVTQSPVMYPHDMCVLGNDLVVAGNFKNAGGKVVNGIARWDGTEWHEFGEGFNGTVYGVCVYNGELYAGGDFTKSGNTDIKYVAKWSDTTWVDPGFSLYYNNPSYYSFIHTLKVINNKMYISGGFDRAKSGTSVMKCTSIAAFDGTILDTLSGGLTGKEVEAIAEYNGHIYAGGGLFGKSYVAGYNLPTSVQYDQNKISINIFPNPSSSTIHIQSEHEFNEISITNAIGQRIYYSDVNTKSISLDLPYVGIYLVTIKAGNSIVTKKILRTLF